MPLFKKNPVVIEAHQWDGTTESADTIIKWSGCGKLDTEKEELHILTLEDGKDNLVRHVASPGDWIIKGVAGEFYPCKPGIFNETYTMVDSYDN